MSNDGEQLFNSTLQNLQFVLKCRCCHRYLGHNIIGVDLIVDDTNKYQQE